MDFKKIAREVYDLANSDDPLAPVVKEALGVIEDGLNTYGWVFQPYITPQRTE